MKPAKPDIVKTTIRVPKSLWDKVRHRAIDLNISAEALVIEALGDFVKKGGN
jgi:hypothetical protein